jgi:diaminohydroxyphosphoribosylaminopyrimidine deaminase / 5-amino-6-(5-phosphoribosylamino)uracil reductase
LPAQQQHLDDAHYMSRCLQLARLGAGRVAPNPLVGAVLVVDDRIIGEGWHQQFGAAHAEVNCLASVKQEDRSLVEKATMYVSLEPCAHYGKTPPCADMLINNKIGKVVVGVRDPFTEVNGKGIEKLKAAGVDVKLGVLEEECRDLNRYFFYYHTRKRPFVLLKWAESDDGKIGATGKERTRISNVYTDRLVHKWRSELMSIMVGRNTVVQDDPALTTRLWAGSNPTRVVLCGENDLPAGAAILNNEAPTIVFNQVKEQSGNPLFIRLNKAEAAIPQVLKHLYELKIHSVLVEGGSKLLQSFIDAGLWDEARIIKNQCLTIQDGVEAPVLKDCIEYHSEKIYTDTISYCYPAQKDSKTF